MGKRISIMGTYVDAITMEETIDKIKYYINSKKCIQHVVINAHKVNMMQYDDKLRKIVNVCPIINADGQSIVWAARKLGYKIPERVTGIDLFEKLIEVAAKEGYKVYFFGATEEVVKKVVEIYKLKYCKLDICGYRSGYFNNEESDNIAEEIKCSKADMLFVGFSSPKKEYWINKYIGVMNVPFCMGVGGSFDVIAGKTKRAPVLMQKLGLEWLYRFIQEPRRMFKRYIVGNIKFIQLVLKYKRVR